MSIYAELAADHQHIVLVAGGDPASAAPAAKALQTLTPLFGKTAPPGGLMTGLSWATVVQLVAMFGADLHQGPALQAWVAAETIRRTAPNPLTYTPPDGHTPRPYQSEGAAMIATLGRTIVMDEPGTGKTITAILGIVERGVDVTTPALVVCPASVVDSWVAAWRAWAPHLTATAWRGTPARRVDLAGTAEVYVTSYDLAHIDAPAASQKRRPLVDLNPAHLVIDECHLIKNPRTKRSQAVVRLAKLTDAHPVSSVVPLSGTPITHHPGDLYPTLEAIDPAAFPSRDRWVRRYCIVLEGEEKDEILGLAKEREPEFRLSLLGQQRRVAKADVLTELPPKVYSVRTVDLPAKWRKAYDDFESTMRAELADGTVLESFSVMAVMTHLSALASAPADVRYTHGPELNELTGEPVQHVHLDLKAPSWKVDALLEVLAERPGEPVVCFAPSKQLIELAGAAATKAGLRVGYVVGGQSAAARTADIDAFQAGDLDLICVTTAAGGVGITLTAARTAVFLQRPWSLVESTQAEDRCHRIGSERHDTVEIIDVVAKDTLDSRVREVLRTRAGQLADLVQDGRIVTSLLGGSDLDLSAGSAVDQLHLVTPAGGDGPGDPAGPPPLERKSA